MTRDDPRITAWALGEYDAPEHVREREKVEAALAADPDLRAEAEAIRASAASLGGALAAEAVPVLDPAHRGAIEEALGDAQGTVPSHPRGGHHPVVPGGLSPVSISKIRDHAGLGALAATLLVAIGFAVAGATGGVDLEAQRSSRSQDFDTPDPELDGRATVRFNDPVPASVASVFAAAGGEGTISDFAPRGGKGGSTYNHFTPGAYGSGGGGGGGGHQTSGPAGARMKFTNNITINGTLGRTMLAQVAPDDVTNGLDNGGVGIPTRDINLQPSGGGAFYLDEESSTESYAPLVENSWVRPLGEAALSTFSIDVDTAGYAIVRRCLLEQGRLPPPGALRIEELVNYFPYRYAPPAGSDPFAVWVDAASCPWNARHRLVRIALKGREVEEAARPAANLVLLLDVSGSMQPENKLPLVKQSVALLAKRLTARDRVAIVVYAGASGLALPSTTGDRQGEILAALDRLGAGGSTNGGAGIELAYKVAAENFVAGGINRVILATDGDFNVGVSDPSALVKLVEEKAKTGVFLTALGYGMDNLKDSTLEQLADKGNGNYGYVDSLREAEKVLVEEGMSTIHTIAKDVKIQVEFNPARVAAFRLVGYENRVLAAQDFADDAKDAGEIGAGHCVTALYEVVPAGEPLPGAPVDELRYQRLTAASTSAESLTVKLRWKEPEGTVSALKEFPFSDDGRAFDAASEDFRFAAAVASFGQVLRDSQHKGDATLAAVREIAASSLGDDRGGYRAEFLTLVDRAAALKR